MEQAFKVGDKVFHYEFGGWGTVIEECSGNKADFPIYCSFPAGKASFTWDGRFYKSYPPTLSFTEYTLEGFSQKRPEELPKMGDIVWVRDDDDDDWVISHFMDYKIDKTFPYGTSIDMTNGSRATWRQMTTKNPYANEQ